MKQRVSGPLAGLIIIVAVLVLVAVLIRMDPGPDPEPEVFFLPFAPPVEQSEVDSLRRGLRPLGIYIVMPPLAEDRLQGARVALVLPGSPAGHAGMRAGDLIVEFNGQRVGHAYAVVHGIETAEPGKPNTVTVERGGERHDLVITRMRVPEPEERVLR